MALLTINGTLKDSRGEPLAGRNVSLHNSGHSNLDTALTDSGGNFSVSIDSASNPPGVYHAHFEGESPHWAAVVSATVDWSGLDQTVTRDLVSPFSNNDPSIDEVIDDQEGEEDSGVVDVFVDVSDVDGDDWDPVKIFGPSWVTFTKQSPTVLKVTINYDAAQEGDADVAVEIEDEFGARSNRREFTVTVTEENKAPVFDALPDQTFILGTGPQTFDIHAVDPNAGDVVSYSKFGPSASWTSVNSETGEVTVDTDAALADGEGDYGHTWRASDGELASNISHTIRMVLGGASLLLTPIT